MPTYSYRCTECGTAFDIQQAFTDDALTECPNCSGALRKLFNNVGVSFSGPGFYRTDSRAKPAASSGDSGSTSSAGATGSGPKETAAKPAAAATSAATSTSTSSD